MEYYSIEFTWSQIVSYLTDRDLILWANRCSEVERQAVVRGMKSSWRFGLGLRESIVNAVVSEKDGVPF